MSDMEIIKKVNDMQKISENFRNQNKTIAVVPTMGYFHEGHSNLMKKAHELADIVITTLFVNPTQFGPNEDYEKYPRDIDRDSKIAQDSGTDYLFVPTLQQMYPKGNITSIHIDGFTKKFEGVTRPNHFDGVATIVTKLFNATKPHIALFGQKDFQQTLLIKQMVNDLLIDVGIVIVPTAREKDGLALSSRNVYLSSQERAESPLIFSALNVAVKAIENGERNRKIINAHLRKVLSSSTFFKIDYAVSADADTLEEPDTFLPGEHIVLLIAAYLGKTRLIDNALVTVKQEPGIKKHYFVEGL
jgi:pantoate--beta-alanine ligase